jgi:hypothetical protein
MAKFNATEKDIFKAREIVKEIFDGDIPKEVEVLFHSSEMGMRSFRVLACIRPFLLRLWDNMSSNNNAAKFAVEKMIRQIDDIIGYWILPDEDTAVSEKEEDDIVEN